MSLLKANGGGLGGAGAPGGALGSFYSYTTDQSLRFEDGDSPALSKTYSTAQTNTKKLTISVWVKRGNLGIRSTILYAKSGSAGALKFQTTDKLYFNAFNTGYNGFESNALFRDTTAWYHIVAQADSDGQTGSNLNRVWVNGVELDNSLTSSFPPDDTATMLLRNGITTYIGDDTDGAYHFDGYLAEMHVIDGSIVAPTEFAETKDGIWIPKAYSGSYGNNGYYLPFSATPGSSVDYDGNANNIRWTDATQYDIASDDDFCLEFFIKANLEAKTTYAIGEYAVSGPHFMLQLGSGTTGNIYAYYGNGLANNFDTTSYMTTTDWHHFAYVRESGTYRFYIDGVQRHTATNGGTAAFNLSQFNVGDAYPAAPAYFDGSLSNLRFTIGAARYGSGTTFTVPTSTLTNDSSNVKLLAYTTSTLTADASTAAVSGSITSGTPVFRRDNPFSDIIGKDAAGSNDFLSSSLFFTDIVPDSPTNNFAVGNLLSSYSNNTFSEGNLKVTGSGVNYYNYLSSFGMETGGKYYFEVYSNKRNSSYWAVGICKPESFSHTMSVYNTAGSMALQQGASVYYLNSTIGTTTNRYNSTAYLFSFAIDLDNNIFHFRADGGTWENSGDPAAGTGGYAIPADLQGQTLMPWFGPNGANYQVLNFGQDSSFANNKTSGSASAADGNGIGDFYYAPPSGFLALASSNLPEPEIIDGTEYFNTVLYTGNGHATTNTQSITGVGFSPDWTWIKHRNGTGSHTLFDVVRGAGKSLRSDTTAGESTQSDSLTSFDSDGFSLGDNSESGAHVNVNSSTYAAWNWKAGGATPTKTYKVVVDNDGANKYRFRNSANSATFATYAPTIELQEGGTYVFDWSDDGTNGAVSAQGHPIRFSTTSDGTHGSGSEYTTGVVKDDSAYTTTITVASGAPTLYYYCQNHSGMGGQVNTNDTFGSSHFDGSILSTVSTNPKAGFSIVSYTGTESSVTIGHGLGVKPSMIIVKKRTEASPGGARGWAVWHQTLDADKVLRLNSTSEVATEANFFVEGNINSTVFGVNADYDTGWSDNYIAYCFADVDGYLKAGSYIGGGSNFPFVYTGFRPAWVMIKSSAGTSQSWEIRDNKREPFNDASRNVLFADTSGVETVDSFPIDFVSNGFKVRNSGNGTNVSGATYIYLAFAESPFKFANAR